MNPEAANQIARSIVNERRREAERNRMAHEASQAKEKPYIAGLITRIKAGVQEGLGSQPQPDCNQATS